MQAKVIESFSETLKKERIYKRKYDTLAQVRVDLLKYIELCYNGKRMHSRLDYMTPVEYRMKYENGKVA